MIEELFDPGARRLELVGAVHRLRLAALESPPAGGYRWPAEPPLYAVRFTGPPARVDVGPDRLRLRYGGFLRFFATRATDLALHPTVRWRLAVRGGLDRSELDLSRLRVDALDITGGLDRVTVRLPTPERELPVALRGGATHLRFVCPPGVGLRVRVDGGVQRIQVDTLRVGAVGGRFAWETPGFARDPRRIDVRVRGGVSDLAVDWVSDPLALPGPFAPTRLAAWPRLFGGT